MKLLGVGGSADDLDRSRRVANTCLTALGLTALCALAIGLRLAVGDGPAVALIGAATMGLTLSSYLLVQRGQLQIAALGLVAAPLLAILAMVLWRGHLDHGALFTLLSPLVAGLLLRPRGVALTMLLTLAVQLLAPALERSPQPWLTPELNAVYVALLTAVTGLVSLLSASSSAQTLSEALRRERRSREAERLYRVVTDQMTDLIGLLDAHGRMIYASPSFERVLGVKPESLLGGRHDELIHPADRPTVEVVWRSALDRGSARGAVRLCHVDGSRRWMEIHLDVTRYEGQVAVTMAARDIDQRRQLEVQVRESQKQEAIGRMAGGLAHDLKNLLLVIDVSCEALEAAVPQEHEARLDLEALREASQRANQLTRQLLSFARREKPASAQPLDLGAAVAGAAGLLSRVLGPGVRLRLELPPDLGSVAMEPGQLEQLLLNLASNARDAMPNGGALTVQGRRRSVGTGEAVPPGDYLELLISDTGQGMPPEVVDRLFEPFFTTKPAGQGTGLGLASCYSSVLQLGGQLTVRSEPGSGSTFTALLPRLAEPQAEPRREVSAAG
jgi:PAS domain S-box-containing protein